MMQESKRDSDPPRDSEPPRGGLELDDELLEAIDGGIGPLLPVQPDAEADGVVDADDYSIWQRNLSALSRRH